MIKAATTICSTSVITGERPDRYLAQIDTPGGSINFTCTHTGRHLTQAEWQRYMGRDVPYRKTCPNLPAGQ